MTKATRNNEEGKAETALHALVVALVPLVAAELRASGVSGDDLVNDLTPGLGMSPRKIRTLAKDGAFRAAKRGRRWYFRRADLEAYVAPAARVTSTPANETADPVADLGRSLGLRIGGAR